MFYNILDKKRLAILPLLGLLKNTFYLSGGTSLALQIGHRDSIDFDFFTKENIDTAKLFEELKSIFENKKIAKVQEEKNTLTVILENTIKLSFFTYKYKLLQKPIQVENLQLASIEDIGCMKLSAIVSRATFKDYVDLFFILKIIKLPILLEKIPQKFPELDANLVLKSLIYFRDIKRESLKFKNNHLVKLKEIEKFFKIEVQKYLIQKF